MPEHPVDTCTLGNVFVYVMQFSVGNELFFWACGFRPVGLNCAVRGVFPVKENWQVVIYHAEDNELGGRMLVIPGQKGYITLRSSSGLQITASVRL